MPQQLSVVTKSRGYTLWERFLLRRLSMSPILKLLPESLMNAGWVMLCYQHQTGASTHLASQLDRVATSSCDSRVPTWDLSAVLHALVLGSPALAHSMGDRPWPRPWPRRHFQSCRFGGHSQAAVAELSSVAPNHQLPGPRPCSPPSARRRSRCSPPPPRHTD